MPDVPEQFLKAVVFLGYRRDAGVEVAGTAFLVSSPNVAYDHEASPPGRIPEKYLVDVTRLQWLVTAKHVVTKILNNSGDGNVILFANARSGGRVNPAPEFHVSSFRQAPDTPEGHLVDLAYRQLTPDPVWDVAPVPIESCASTPRIVHAGIRPGMEVFCPGFFWGKEGVSRNTPVMRVGTVAAPADYSEPIALKSVGAEIVAHLIGMTVTRGMSGSPVFVAMPTVRVGEEADKSFTYLRMRAGGEFFLLGVLLAHFEEDGDTSGGDTVANAGLSVVLHADYLAAELADATRSR